MVEVRVSRRQALTGLAAIAGVAALGGADALPAAAQPTIGGEAPAPFGLGVASGDPLPDGVVLWTRLVRDRYAAASLGSRPIQVRWQVATDERFRRVVRSGVARARPELAHSVHVDVRGLEPGREYFYRFRASSDVSPTGRTRTAPARHADPRKLRLAVVSCQDLQNGYWPALAGLAAEDLDVVLHLGDYIYEYDPDSRFADRRHVAPATVGLDQLRTLDDYRNRHAQYKSDPALRAAHAASAWVATWDDHETENNYADLVDEIDDTGAEAADPGGVRAAAGQRVPGVLRTHADPGAAASPAAAGPAHLPALRLRPAGAVQRARHPAVPHRPARRLPERPRPGGAGSGERHRHAHRRRAGALAARRPGRLARPVERHRAAGR